MQRFGGRKTNLSMKLTPIVEKPSILLGSVPPVTTVL
jgi:hypothetical protein